jgi:hypothetical protein
MRKKQTLPTTMTLAAMAHNFHVMGRLAKATP